MTTVELTLIDRYAAGPQTLRQAVAGLPCDQQLVRPIAGRWSTLEVVCHLADMDGVYADRTKRVIAEDGPTLFDADQDQFAAAPGLPGARPGRRTGRDRKRPAPDDADLTKSARGLFRAFWNPQHGRPRDAGKAAERRHQPPRPPCAVHP